MVRRDTAAQTKASAIPVLPDVGSTMVAPGPIRPSRSNAIIDTPIRSLMLASGLKNSSLTKTSAFAPWASAKRQSEGLHDIVVDAATAGRVDALVSKGLRIESTFS